METHYGKEHAASFALGSFGAPCMQGSMVHNAAAADLLLDQALRDLGNVGPRQGSEGLHQSRVEIRELLTHGGLRRGQIREDARPIRVQPPDCGSSDTQRFAGGQVGEIGTLSLQGLETASMELYGSPDRSWVEEDPLLVDDPIARNVVEDSIAAQAQRLGVGSLLEQSGQLLRGAVYPGAA